MRIRMGVALHGVLKLAGHGRFASAFAEARACLA
jgi:hypothetical protein